MGKIYLVEIIDMIGKGEREKSYPCRLVSPLVTELVRHYNQNIVVVIESPPSFFSSVVLNSNRRAISSSHSPSNPSRNSPSGSNVLAGPVSPSLNSSPGDSLVQVHWLMSGNDALKIDGEKYSLELAKEPSHPVGRGVFCDESLGSLSAEGRSRSSGGGEVRLID